MMRVTKFFRIPHHRAADMEASRRALECCQHFGVPYQACVLPGYRPEVRRLRSGDMPIGYLNQDWPGPLLVWYPCGDWTQGESDATATVSSSD